MTLRAFTRGVASMGKMNEADALLQCVLRSLKLRCSPTDAGAEPLWLYDEITVLEKSAIGIPTKS